METIRKRPTCCQCRSRMPGLQMTFRIGRCCLNLSIFTLMRSATFLGPGWSDSVFVSLYIDLHISDTSFSTSSALIPVNGPETRDSSPCQSDAPPNSSIKPPLRRPAQLAPARGDVYHRNSHWIITMSPMRKL